MRKCRKIFLSAQPDQEKSSSPHQPPAAFADGAKALEHRDRPAHAVGGRGNPSGIQAYAEILGRAPTMPYAGSNLKTHMLNYLQRTYGNAFVQRMIHSGSATGNTGVRLGQENARVAGVVMHKPEADIKKDGAGCALTTFTGSSFTGKTVMADVEFVDSLGAINAHAVANDVDVYVTSSFRTTTVVPGAIVKPAKMSNHLAGHAIDMNVKYGKNKVKWCNSKCLKSALPKGVSGFITAIRKDPGLRWGGDFSKKDPVHIDDHLNEDKKGWRSRFDATQKARKAGCG